MELIGRIIAALPEKNGVSAKGEWKVQEFVLETKDASFPRKMVFSVFGADRLARFNIQVGQDVTVAFDIDAHEYNGRWFNSIRAYDVRPVDPAAASAAAPVPPASVLGSAPAPAAPAAPASDPTKLFDEPAGSPDDGLPF